ncbi:MAG: hypothetical protein GQE15_01050 [Archangiaceae bacterium]|nr:hypothetical protein [Archangiaceae bacterium]
MRALLPVSFVVTFSCAHVPRAGVPVVTTQDEATVVFVRPAHLVGSAIAPSSSMTGSRCWRVVRRATSAR